MWLVRSHPIKLTSSAINTMAPSGLRERHGYALPRNPGRFHTSLVPVFVMPRKPPTPVSFASEGMRGLVESESARWVDFLIALLKKEGRPIEGGWPGTVSEARSRLMARLAKQADQPPQDAAAVTILADQLYNCARLLWLSSATSHRKQC
jgi:hypothetical protein